MDERGKVRQRILVKALELFSEKGYEGVSVEELTKASDITKPTLYYYFKSKLGVFDAVCQSNYAQLNSIISENTVYKPNPQVYFEDIFLTLTKLTSAYFSFSNKNEAFYRITLVNMSMPRSSGLYSIVKKYHFTQFDIIENMFRDMAKTHGNLRGKAKALSWSYIGTVSSYISLFLSGMGKGAMNEKSVKELVHQFMHGIYA
ncbi:MAG: TetR/AcrR family transcriptional regulator [Treponema sp.]|nr:TetR/AcrR family transcriptional regulator [Treponema sp.]